MVPREERAPVAPRTLDSLQVDLLLFQTAGNGDLKKAKNYNNVIGPYFFHIPLTQVINKNPSDARTCIKILHVYTLSGLSARTAHHTRHILPLVVLARDGMP